MRIQAIFEWNYSSLTPTRKNMKSDNYHAEDPEWGYNDKFSTFVAVWGKSINEINEVIQHFVENNNILEQYEKSNKRQSLDFKNPVLEIESNTQDNPRWNSANNQWETTFIARVVEYTVFRHS